MTVRSESFLTVLAVGAHPDDIEFMMAGTVLRLRDTGCRIHLWNLANGCCGSDALSREETAALRWAETQASAALCGAEPHEPLYNDFEIFYDHASVRKVAAVIREVQPDILLTQSPQDYMEDHQNTARLAVTGAFTRGMRNVVTDPPLQPVLGSIAVYHALPHGLRDALRERVTPHFYVDISSVLARKRAMLAAHESQRLWLDRTQGMGSYLDEMEAISRDVGRMSGAFQFAEGWRRHSHLGFGAEDWDPLSEMLAEGGRVPGTAS